MSTVTLILFLLAGVFAIWQIGLGIAAIAILRAGNRVTSIGAGPGAVAIILAVIAIITL